jgi:peptidoglycan/xylan/chitin deacetylase (PgdA/CDA1 family)
MLKQKQWEDDFKIKKQEIIDFILKNERIPVQRKFKTTPEIKYESTLRARKNHYFKKGYDVADLGTVWNYYDTTPMKQSLIDYLKEFNKLPSNKSMIILLRDYIEIKDPRILDLLKKLNLPTII